MNKITYVISIVFITLTVCICISCNEDEVTNKNSGLKWIRDAQNPVLRDVYPDNSYQSASDGHVFYDDNNNLRMIYSGNVDGNSSIKLASATSLVNWEIEASLLAEPNSENTDIEKETAFYRKTSTGKHQIFYIGYQDNSTYQSQIFLAESDNLVGNYTQITEPVVARGNLANKPVYCITSPSIVEHNGLLYITFIGWNASPLNVTQVWLIGATSTDNGHTWNNYQIIETPIGMEGQITKTPDGTFVAVRTGEFEGEEAIFYATSTHPFGPWTSSEIPILKKENSNLEKDEIIAPQITFDQQTGEEYLFYTGADYQTGWWMMLAKKE